MPLVCLGARTVQDGERQRLPQEKRVEGGGGVRNISEQPTGNNWGQQSRSAYGRKGQYSSSLVGRQPRHPWSENGQAGAHTGGAHGRRRPHHPHATPPTCACTTAPAAQTTPPTLTIATLEPRSPLIHVPPSPTHLRTPSRPPLPSTRPRTVLSESQKCPLQDQPPLDNDHQRLVRDYLIRTVGLEERRDLPPRPHHHREGGGGKGSAGAAAGRHGFATATCRGSSGSSSGCGGTFPPFPSPTPSNAVASNAVGHRGHRCRGLQAHSVSAGKREVVGVRRASRQPAATQQRAAERRWPEVG